MTKEGIKKDVLKEYCYPPLVMGIVFALLTAVFGAVLYFFNSVNILIPICSETVVFLCFAIWFLVGYIKYSQVKNMKYSIALCAVSGKQYDVGYEEISPSLHYIYFSVYGKVRPGSKGLHGEKGEYYLVISDSSKKIIYVYDADLYQPDAADFYTKNHKWWFPCK